MKEERTVAQHHRADNHHRRARRKGEERQDRGLVPPQDERTQRHQTATKPDRRPWRQPNGRTKCKPQLARTASLSNASQCDRPVLKPDRRTWRQPNGRTKCKLQSARTASLSNFSQCDRPVLKPDRRPWRQPNGRTKCKPQPARTAALSNASQCDRQVPSICSPSRTASLLLTADATGAKQPQQDEDTGCEVPPVPHSTRSPKARDHRLSAQLKTNNRVHHPSASSPRMSKEHRTTRVDPHTPDNLSSTRLEDCRCRAYPTIGISTLGVTRGSSVALLGVLQQSLSAAYERPAQPTRSHGNPGARASTEFL